MVTNLSSKAGMYNLRLKPLSITVIDSFILACQCIFLKTLVSIHPPKQLFFGYKNFKERRIKNNNCNNLNTNFSHTQSFIFYQIIINKYSGLYFHRDNCNFNIRENGDFEPLIVDSKLPL